MAPILFDVNKAKEQRKFTFTMGESRETSRWTNQRRFDFKTLSAYLSRVPDIGKKDGGCYTPALFEGSRRDLQKSRQIDVVVLDSDCGHSASYIQQALAAKGWRAIIHSTYSHMVESTAVSASAYHKWQAENPGRSVGEYMIAKKGYLPEIMCDATVIDEIAEGKASNLIIKHAPCPKFRILLPLHRPWLAEDYASQDLANATWRERIGALAAAIGLYYDQSCVDTSRLFYFPRVKDAAAQATYTCLTLDGEDCDLWSLPDAPPTGANLAANTITTENTSLFDYAAKNTTSNNVVPLIPRSAIEKQYYVNRTTGELFDLTTWAAKYALRFEIVKAIKARQPDIMSNRKNGVKHHIYCVRSGDHLTSGLEGTGTYIVNASDKPRSNLPSHVSGFVINCKHNGCSNVDRLEHIRELLDKTALTVADLTDPEFLCDDPNASAAKVDVSAVVSKFKENKSEVIAETKIEIKHRAIENIEHNSNIPLHLCENLPDALGAMCDYTLRTAKKRQPVLTLGAMLALAATVIGQRVKLQHYGTRPNIYIFGIGTSGSGKDWPLKACELFAHAAGLADELIGVQEVASDTGIVNAVCKHPRQLIALDEISHLLSAINDPRAGTHIKGIVSVFLRLYSSSSSRFKGKSYADDTLNKSVNQPCVSFLGMSTQAGFTNALSNKDIESGLLSRMMVFDAGIDDPRVVDPRIKPIENVEVPEEIIQWIQAWNAVKPVPNMVAMNNGERVMAPREVLMTDEALNIAINFEGEMHELKQQARPRGKDALYVRAFENALKFALIRACSIWPVANAAGTGLMVDESALCVDATTMRWAVDLSRATVARMDTATDEIADTPYEQALKALRKAIQRSGVRGMSIPDLARIPAGKLPVRQRDDLLNTLMEAKEIKYVKMAASGGRGRPRNAYIHKKFFAEHGVSAIDDDDDDTAVLAGE